MSGKVRKEAAAEGREAMDAPASDPDLLPGLNQRQSRAVALLTEGASKKRVARLVGVDDRTVRRWTAIPEFATALASVRREGVVLARVRLSGAVDLAINTLREVLRDKSIPAAVRVRAAEAVLVRAGLDEKPEQSADGGDKPLTDEDMALARRFLAERDADSSSPPRD